MKFYRKTKRLILRPIVRSDFAVWKSANENTLPPKNEFDSPKRPASELTRSNFLAIAKTMKLRAKQELYCTYGVFLRKNGELIGYFNTGHFIRSVTQSSFLGYSIFNNHWGHGYAEEALHALIDIAFKDHKLHRVVAGIEPQNKRSLRLIKKFKFRREGLAKRVVFIRGEWRDLIQFALTTEDLNLKWSGTLTPPKR